MTKIVVNRCYGGFGLSLKAIKYYLKLNGKEAHFYKQTKHYFREGENEYKKLDGDKFDEFGFIFTLTKDVGDVVNEYPEEYYWSYYDIERNDPNLVKTVEDLDDEANGRSAELEVVEIPDDVKWEIEEYDGKEWVSETHRTW